MKFFKNFSLVLLLCLLGRGSVFATATYDYLSDTKITFNHLWSNFTPTFTSTTFGTGQHNESTAPSQDVNLESFWYYQSAHITGFAGNDSLTQSGISYASNTVETLFTFDFGSVSTDLMVTLTDWNQVLASSTQLNLWNPDNQTGEYVGYWPTLGGGGTSLGLAFDGQGFAIPGWEKGNSTIFYNLTGQHTIRVMTDASETAIAGYPYVQTPEPSTLLLFGSGLVGLFVFRRRFKK